MSDSHPNSEDVQFVRRAVEAAIRIGTLALLTLWAYKIVQPFISPVLWGVIIAIAVLPAYRGLTARLGGRRKLTAALLTVLALALLLVPAVKFFGDAIDGTRSLAAQLDAGTLTIPPPPAKVATWPLVGDRLNDAWSLASSNLDSAIERYQPQLKAIGAWLLSAGGGLGIGVLQFVISIIIAGVFLATGEAGGNAARRIATRFAGEQGAEFAEMAEKTIRSVALGVLGVAVIQSALSLLGMIVVGVPAAGLWALIVLIIAVIQLPPILLLGPVAVYVFSTASTVPAVLFLIWAILVSASDAFLKPLLLGRGVNVPTLVILVGAIGGMMLSGIIGLFVGAVVLALGYQLFMAWLADVPPATQEAEANSTG
ncbi:MAG: AI-2E family transporter [Acidimicrobiia bacterium]